MKGLNGDDKAKIKEIAGRWKEKGVPYAAAKGIAAEAMEWKGSREEAAPSARHHRTLIKSFEPTKGWTERVDEYINDMYSKHEVVSVNVTMAHWGESAFYPTVHVIIVTRVCPEPVKDETAPAGKPAVKARKPRTRKTKAAGESGDGRREQTGK